MRRKRGAHTMRTARIQSIRGPLQHFPTGSKLSHLTWFPKEMTVTQSCSVGTSVCPTCFNPILHKGTVSKMWASHVFCKNGKTGMFWEQLGCSGVTEHAALRYSLLVFRETTQDVWLLSLVACGTIGFLYHDFCEVMLHPCGFVQGIRDSANLHLGNPQQYEES